VLLERVNTNSFNLKIASLATEGIKLKFPSFVPLIVTALAVPVWVLCMINFQELSSTLAATKLAFTLISNELTQFTNLLMSVTSPGGAVNFFFWLRNLY